MKKLVAMILCLMLLYTSVALADENLTIRFSTQNVPDSAPYYGMEAFKEKLEELSKGSIQVELYHSGSLYAADAEYDAIACGDLEMMLTDQYWLMDYMPYMSTLTAGYIFSGYEHMYKVLNGEIGNRLYEDVANTLGLRPLGACYFGARVLSFREGLGKIIETPDQMAGLTFRMPGTTAYLFLGEALGASPTPLALGEVYLALSTGTIDGQDNPLVMLDTNKFYEVTESITLTNHTLSSVWPAISEDFWQKLDDAQKDMVQQAIAAMIETCDSYVLEQEASLADKFAGMGITIVEPDIPLWMEHVQNYYLADEEMTSNWDMGLYEEIKGLA